MLRHLDIVQNAITVSEERELIKYFNKLLARKKYEGDHWDSVIKNYKELEVNSNIPKEVLLISEKVKKTLFQLPRFKNAAIPPLLPMHIIDLHQDGHIGPHVDSIKFSGDLIAVLSLQSTRILRLSPAPETFELPNQYTKTLEFRLSPRSLYLLTGPLRYNYNHEVLGNELPPRLLPPVENTRRLSLMFRDMHEKDIQMLLTNSSGEGNLGDNNTNDRVNPY